MKKDFIEHATCKNCIHYNGTYCTTQTDPNSGGHYKISPDGHCNRFEEGENGYTKNLKETDKEREFLKQEVINLLALKEKRHATEMIVEYIMKHNYIYTTKDDVKSEMWHYEDGIYVPQGRSYIKQFCREVLGELFTSHLINEVMNKIEADTYIEADKLFNQEHLHEIPLENGILDIITRDLTDFTPKKIFFNKLPVSYNPEAKCELIDKFLSDVLKDAEDKKVLYELAGFGLLKDYRFEKAVMMIGNGRNGKGKTIELLKRLVGAHNCSGIPLSSLNSQSFAISELFGKFFNLAGDLSSTDLKDTGMFKSLTGRDQISAQRKFLRDLIFVNYSKMVFACNDLPRVYDYSVGFWERWLLLEFPYRFVDKETFDNTSEKERKNWKIKDEDIIEKITTESEMSGFLNAALDGLKRLLANHKFSYTKGTDEIKNTWIRKSDSFMAFSMDCIEEDYDELISKKEMRKRYMKYCKEHRVGGRSDMAIKATLQEMFGVSEEFTTSTGLGTQEHCWVGIKWKKKW